MEVTTEQQMIEGLVRKTTREELFKLGLLNKLAEMRGWKKSSLRWIWNEEILLNRDEAVSLGVE